MTHALLFEPYFDHVVLTINEDAKMRKAGGTLYTGTVKGQNVYKLHVAIDTNFKQLNVTFFSTLFQWD